MRFKLIYTLRLLLFGFVGIVVRNSHVLCIHSCCSLLAASPRNQNNISYIPVLNPFGVKMTLSFWAIFALLQKWSGLFVPIPGIPFVTGIHYPQDPDTDII